MKRLILLAALWIATTAGAQEIRKETFAYAVRESDTLRLDRYAALTPDSRKRPCLMFLFGGGFMTGTRDNGPSSTTMPARVSSSFRSTTGWG